MHTNVSFRKKILLLLFLIKIIKVEAQNEGMGFIGTAVEAFSPCEKHVLTMEREIGGPPGKQNYWDGSVSLDNWPTIPEVRISLTVDNLAKIEVNPNDGRVISSNNTFHISYFESPPKINHVNFRIRGHPKMGFPNVVSLKLNGLEICENATKWKPSILDDDVVDTDFNTETTTKLPNICGHRLINHQGLITSGFPTQPGAWPWHAAINHRTNREIKYQCGGTLINKKIVLTAAHCVTEYGRVIIPERILVQLGKHNLKLSDPNTQELEVFNVIPHENFQLDNFQNDIALLILATEAVLTKFIQPACLWPATASNIDNLVDHLGTVIGWGITEKNKVSDIINQGTMPIVSLLTCLSSDRTFYGNFLTDKTYCAGFRNGTSVCNGDSGGGMFFEMNEQWYIRGIVSLSQTRDSTNLCNSKEYVLFTDIVPYLNWIIKYY